MWTQASPATKTLGLGLMVRGVCDGCQPVVLGEVDGTSPPVSHDMPRSLIAVKGGMKLHACVWDPLTAADLGGQGSVDVAPEQAFTLTGTVIQKLPASTSQSSAANWT